MIKTELVFFEVQVESVLRDTIELSQSSFSETPKRLNAIDMIRTFNELIIAMIDPQVLVKADVYQAIIAWPTIGIDHTVRINLTSNDGLQGGFRSIGYDLRINTIAPFK